jgi:TetR/AcrR family transcriptional regulator, repressor of fatR-cypB operon
MTALRKRRSGDSGQEEKRDAILEAALELFAERGFDGTAVPQLAEKARVGAGTIYRYFENKEALVNALFQREKSRLLAAVLADFPFDRPPREQFRVFFCRMASLAKHNPLSAAFLELHHHAPYLDQASRDIEERGNQLIETAVRAAIEQEVMKDLSPRLICAIVLGIFDGLLRAWLDRRIELDRETISSAEQCAWEAIRR